MGNVISMQDYKDKKRNMQALKVDNVIELSGLVKIESIINSPGFIRNMEYERILIEARSYSLGQLDSAKEWICNNKIQTSAQADIIRDAFIDFCLIEGEIKKYLTNGTVDAIPFTTA